MTHEVSRRSSLPGAMAWMLGLSVALAWLPFVGGLIAGFVGGRKAGNAGQAVLAAVLPGLVLGLLFLVAAPLLSWIPIVGPIFAGILGMGKWVLASVHLVPLLIGAIVGGVTADRHR